MKQRVELHCHTKMSEFRGTTDVKDLICHAHNLGMKAVAITDDGSLAAFPVAQKVLEEYSAEEFKVIYGVEAYLADDTRKILFNDRGQDIHQDIILVDSETTGFSPVENEFIELQAIKISGGKVVDRFYSLVKPQMPISDEIAELTGITNKSVQNAPAINEVWTRLLAFGEGCVWGGYRTGFDISFYQETASRLGGEFKESVLDLWMLEQAVLSEGKKSKPDIELFEDFTKEGDWGKEYAEKVASAYQEMIHVLEQKGIRTFAEVNPLLSANAEYIKKLPTRQVVLLVQNETGKKNLYHMMSEAATVYYRKVPRIPLSMFVANREGLLVGSSTIIGGLYNALITGEREDKIQEFVEFCDYLEIQPVLNYRHLIESDNFKYHGIKSEEDIRILNRQIVTLGERYGKPVVATGDVFYLRPEDVWAKTVLLHDAGYEYEQELQCQRYFKDTETMLQEFAYLGEEKAYEIVVTNSNKIADSTGHIEPLPKEKVVPLCSDSADKLKQICYDRACELYGEKLPDEVETRLASELERIIENGFETMYLGMKELKDKAGLQDYQYYARGLASASLVIYLCGLTGCVNPLPPHYRCEIDRYSEFPDVSQQIEMGCQLPDKNCPICGKWLKKEGFGLPYPAKDEQLKRFKPVIGVVQDKMEKAEQWVKDFPGVSQVVTGGVAWRMSEQCAEEYMEYFIEENKLSVTEAEKESMHRGLVGVACGFGASPTEHILFPQSMGNVMEHIPLRLSEEKEIVSAFDWMDMRNSFYSLSIIKTDLITLLARLVQETGFMPTEISLEDKSVLDIFKLSKGAKAYGYQQIPILNSEYMKETMQHVQPTCFADVIKFVEIWWRGYTWGKEAQDILLRESIGMESILPQNILYATLLWQLGYYRVHFPEIYERVFKECGVSNPETN